MTVHINDKFQYLRQLTQMVAMGTAPSLIITGEGGLGKTYTVTSTLNDHCFIEGEDYVHFKGYSTARGLYNTLYDNNGKTLILDDFDSVLEDKVAINILKSALDSYDVRKVTWGSMKAGDKYPNTFEFTGRIIFISNKSNKDIDQAIITRSLVVDLTMTADEKIDRMNSIIEDIMPNADICAKIDALTYLDNNKNTIELSLRSLIKLTNIITSFPKNWEKLANFMLKG